MTDLDNMRAMLNGADIWHQERETLDADRNLAEYRQAIADWETRTGQTWKITDRITSEHRRGFGMPEHTKPGWTSVQVETYDGGTIEFEFDPDGNLRSTESYP